MNDFLLRVAHGLGRQQEARRRLIRKLRHRRFFTNLSNSISLDYGTKKIDRQVISKSQLLEIPTSNGYNSRLQHFFKERAIVGLMDALLMPETGGIYLEQSGIRHFVMESTEWPVERRMMFDEMPRKAKTKHYGLIARGISQTGYYHAITEEIPQILQLQSLGPTFIQSESNIAIAKEVYQALGVEFQQVRSRDAVSAESLTFITRGMDVGYLHPTSLEFLRNFRDLTVRDDVPKYEKIFVSREGSRRAHKLESAKRKHYEEMGFVTIKPHEYSLIEQISIFRSCRELVGFHGAGLVNAVWSDKCIVRELMPGERINRCYEWQSYLCGHDYYVEILSS